MLMYVLLSVSAKQYTKEGNDIEKSEVLQEGRVKGDKKAENNWSYKKKKYESSRFEFRAMSLNEPAF